MHQTALAWGSAKEGSNRSKQPLMSVGHDGIHLGDPACAQILYHTHPAILTFLCASTYGKNIFGSFQIDSHYR